MVGYLIDAEGDALRGTAQICECVLRQSGKLFRCSIWRPGLPGFPAPEDAAGLENYREK